MLVTSLLGGADVLFLDEPTAGVDPDARAQIMGFIGQIKKERAVILTTHQMEETEWLCDHLGIMVNGDFVAHGTLKDLITRNASGYTLEISLSNLTAASVKMLERYVTSNLDDVVLTERDTLVIAYSIPDINLLGTVFEVAENLKQKYGCEYVVSEMSIEQVFLNLTSTQRDEDYEDL